MEEVLCFGNRIFGKIASAPNDPKMTLKAKMPNVSYTCKKTTRKSQISIRFTLRSLVFQIIEVFDISIGYNDEIEIFEKKSLQMSNSKFQKSQTQFCVDHWEENSGKV